MPSFPALSTGAYVQYGYQVKHSFDVIENNPDSGAHFADYRRPTPTYFITIPLANLKKAERATIDAFWDARGAGYESFSFTDPWTGTAYPNVRFDQISLDWSTAGPEQNSVTIRLKQDL